MKTLIDHPNPLQRDILRWLRRTPGLSRAGLARQLNARPNSVGKAVEGLLNQRMVREGLSDAEGTTGAGRPQVPLSLDTTASGRTILGVAVQAGRDGLGTTVHARPVGLSGRALGPAWHGQAGPDAVRAIAALRDPRTLRIAVSMPGLLDDADEPPSLPGLFAAMGDLPITIDNDNHALAARWRLTQPPEAEPQDTLVVQLGDGRLGASLLVDGRPNRGVIRGGNELGHTRFPLKTDTCLCGHTGCLERIASTAFLHRHRASRVRTLAELTSAFPSGEAHDDAAVRTMLDALSMGVANALQLLRPHRLVVVSEFTRYPGFRNAWFDRMRTQLFRELRERIVFDRWDQPLSSPAESAAYLGLAALFDARVSA